MSGSLPVSVCVRLTPSQRHRRSDTLEPRDVQLHLERNWHITVPGFAADEVRPFQAPTVSGKYKQRLATVKKAIASNASSEAQAEREVGGGMGAWVHGCEAA